MNQRQIKKRMKKVLAILNEVEVVDSDYDSGMVLYVDVADNEQNRDIIKEVCGILGLDKEKFIAECKESILYEETLNLASCWHYLMQKEPKKLTIWHSVSKGFSLERYSED